MSVSRWDPFQDLLAIQDEMNQVFGRARQGQAGGRVWAPARTVIFFGLASSALGTTTSSTPFSNEASIASACTCEGRVIERRKLP